MVMSFTPVPKDISIVTSIVPYNYFIARRRQLEVCVVCDEGIAANNTITLLYHLTLSISSATRYPLSWNLGRCIVITCQYTQLCKGLYKAADILPVSDCWQCNILLL